MRKHCDCPRDLTSLENSDDVQGREVAGASHHRRLQKPAKKFEKKQTNKKSTLLQAGLYSRSLGKQAEKKPGKHNIDEFQEHTELKRPETDDYI